MKERIVKANHSLVSDADGRPLAVIVPIEDYRALMAEQIMNDDAVIPHEVVMLLGKYKSLIRAWREYLGLTQIEAARRINVSQPTYCQMEADSVRPRLDTLKKIAGAFGIKLEQLVME
jgi:DNA-binding XRE family transcriptional regulator